MDVHVVESHARNVGRLGGASRSHRCCRQMAHRKNPILGLSFLRKALDFFAGASAGCIFQFLRRRRRAHQMWMVSSCEPFTLKTLCVDRQVSIGEFRKIVP
jgi:hypothetical protein